MLFYFSFGLQMFYNVNLFNELLNFYSSGSKFLEDYLNKPFSYRAFCPLFSSPFSYRTFFDHLVTGPVRKLNAYCTGWIWITESGEVLFLFLFSFILSVVVTRPPNFEQCSWLWIFKYFCKIANLKYLNNLKRG